MPPLAGPPLNRPESMMNSPKSLAGTKAGRQRRRARLPKRAQDVLDAAMYRVVRIVDDGVPRNATVQEAILLKIALSAANGNKRAFKVLLEFQADPTNYEGGQARGVEIIRFGQKEPD